MQSALGRTEVDREGLNDKRPTKNTLSFCLKNPKKIGITTFKLGREGLPRLPRKWKINGKEMRRISNQNLRNLDSRCQSRSHCRQKKH